MKKYFSLFFTFVFLSLANPCLAIVSNPLLPDQLHVTNPQQYANNVISTIFSLFFIIGVLYFLWHFVMATFHMISTEGDVKKFDEAKHELMWTIVGLGITFCVFAVLKLLGIIFGITGLENLKITWPTI